MRVFLFQLYIQSIVQELKISKVGFNFCLPQGHTAGEKDIHVNLRMEITRNFDPGRRLRGAAIAVQTVNYFAKKPHSKSKKLSFETDNQRLIESKKVVFSDEVLNMPSQPSATHKLCHGSEGRLHFCDNAWQNIEKLTGSDLPYRHVSSPDIHSPAEQMQVEISDLVLNAASEESVLPHQTKHGFSWSENNRKPVLRTRHDPSLQDDFSLCASHAAPDSHEDCKSRTRKRSHGARVESKDGTPINRFHVPQITQNDSLNLGQFTERDVVLKPVLIGESTSDACTEQTLDSKASDASEEKEMSISNLTEELKRLKMSLTGAANVAVEV